MREKDKFACSLFKEAWISYLVVSTLYGVSKSWNLQSHRAFHD